MRDEKEENESKKDELIPVGDGADASTAEEREVDRPEERKAADERDDREESRLGGSEDDDDDDDDQPRRGRRDMSMRERRQLRKRARDRDRTELRYLRARNEALERENARNAERLDKLELATVSSRITQLKSAIRNADTVFVRATTAGDEEKALEAQRLKNEFTEQLARLQSSVSASSRESAERAERQEQPERRVQEELLDDDIQDRVSDWLGRNRWFKISAPDQNTRIAMAIDAAVRADGFDPATDEYYQELDDRIAEAIPQLRERGGDRRDARREDADQPRRREERDEREDRRYRREERDARPRGPRFRVNGKERDLKANEVYVDAERRKALEEMGVWDDPVLRNKYLKSFKKYDEERASEQTR